MNTYTEHELNTNSPASVLNDARGLKTNMTNADQLVEDRLNLIQTHNALKHVCRFMRYYGVNYAAELFIQ